MQHNFSSTFLEAAMEKGNTKPVMQMNFCSIGTFTALRTVNISYNKDIAI